MIVAPDRTSLGFDSSAALIKRGAGLNRRRTQLLSSQSVIAVPFAGTLGTLRWVELEPVLHTHKSTHTPIPQTRAGTGKLRPGAHKWLVRHQNLVNIKKLH